MYVYFTCLQPLMSYQSHDRCSTTYFLITCKVHVLFKIFVDMTARQQNAYYKQYIIIKVLNPWFAKGNLYFFFFTLYFFFYI